MYEEVFISKTALENLTVLGTEFDKEIDLLLIGGEEVDFGEEDTWIAIKYPKYDGLKSSNSKHPPEFLNVRRILDLLPPESYYHL